jgi:hypothetical protein
LVAAPDAIAFSTDGLSADQVVDQLEAIVRGRMQIAGGRKQKAR